MYTPCVPALKHVLQVGRPPAPQQLQSLQRERRDAKEDTDATANGEATCTSCCDAVGTATSSCLFKTPTIQLDQLVAESDVRILGCSLNAVIFGLHQVQCLEHMCSCILLSDVTVDMS
jgi:hypothetical protein